MDPRLKSPSFEGHLICCLGSREFRAVKHWMTPNVLNYTNHGGAKTRKYINRLIKVCFTEFMHRISATDGFSTKRAPLPPYGCLSSAEPDGQIVRRRRVLSLGVYAIPPDIFPSNPQVYGLPLFTFDSPGLVMGNMPRFF